MNVYRLSSVLRQAKSLQNGLKSYTKAPVLTHANHINVSQRYVSTVDAKTVEKEDGLLQKAFKKIKFAAFDKVKIKGTAFFLYEGIADKINYAQFFDEFDLPDTFYSWFVVTELHIWMLSVRVMAEDLEGRHLRNCLVEALWTDVAQRVKKIGGLRMEETREQIFELSEQLQAALIAYDEGLQSSDIVLAGALWRRIYQQGPVNVTDLEALVKYIRKQITLLDNSSRDQMFVKKQIDWAPLS
ncbi:ubiquinol-cytochrome-c reductase complex assembly factor 1 [Aethina tumida]|uniref:ubiquinol-cytochrome-c reductase complex assembly factor 1 n=1 Tax=Aethina tumida TaxID=116153 RepID=UPI00214879C5|nr:ubiquinol-cytochrome-c reductase complex assembly factor 1 [Aethina tumida]